MDGVRKMKEGGEWRSAARGVLRGLGAASAVAMVATGVGGGQWHVSSTHPGGIVID